nr:ribonuclease H-like domain-containing protein [Tanacetum cinerariifolium]
MRPFRCPVTIRNTIDYLGKFYGKADGGFFVGYSLNSKAFKVFKCITRIVEENLHIRFSESTPNVIGSGPNWLFDIDAQTRTMNYEPTVAGTQSNDLIDLKSPHDDGSKPASDDEKKVDKDPRKESKCKDQENEDNVNSTNNVVTTGNVNTISSTVNVSGTNEVNVVGGKISIELPFDPKMHDLEDDNIFDVLSDDEDDKVKTASTPMETQNPLLKDEDGEEVDVHMYRSMIGSLMYLISSRSDIMFVVCAYVRYQVNQMVSHLHAVKMIFRIGVYAGDSKLLLLGITYYCWLKVNAARRDLRITDEKGIDCLPNSTIFEQIALMGFVQTILDTQPDELPTHERIYIAPSHTKKIFVNMRMAGKGFSRNVTPLFQTISKSKDGKTWEQCSKGVMQ